MKVLVDTSVWSLALRHRSRLQHPAVQELRSLVDEGRVAMIGAIRQELLSGIRTPRSFQRLRDHLRPFPDERLEEADYEHAAGHFNTCRARGVQGSNTDFLICAVAERRNMPILTTDVDFTRFAEILPIVLHGRPAT
jgi:predicted nucleic acid-binding protein